MIPLNGTSDHWNLITDAILPIAVAGIVVVVGWIVERSLKVEREQEREARRKVSAAEAKWVNIGSILASYDVDFSRVIDISDGRESEQSQDTSPETPPDALALASLWELTHARLDLYHQIATGQARKSFRNAQGAMVAGFLLLAVLAGVAAESKTVAGSAGAASLGAVAAAFSAYISRTFVRSQESSAEHLRAYFEQPLQFANFLAAERVIANAGLSDAERAKAVNKLVAAIVAAGTAERPAKGQKPKSRRRKKKAETAAPEG